MKGCMKMANSLIDDMFAENSQFSNNGGIKSPKNGSKKVLLIGLAIIIVVALVALIFFMGKMKKPDIKLSAKGDFIKYLSTASPTSWIDMTSLEEKFELLKANSSESKTTITVASNMEELSLLTGAELTIDTEYDANNHRGLLDFDFEYMKNKLFNMQTLITGEKIAVKADEIVVKYVGYKLENVINVVTDFSEETEDVSGNSIGVQNIVGNVIEKIKKIDYIYIFDSLNAEFMQSESAKYAQVLNSIEDAKFTQKEVTLERDTGNVNSIAYTLTLNEQDIMNLFAALLEEIKNDTEMISIFTTALEPTGLGITDEQVKVYIDNLISSTYEYEADTSKTVKVTMFVVNGQVVSYAFAQN